MTIIGIAGIVGVLLLALGVYVLLGECGRNRLRQGFGESAGAFAEAEGPPYRCRPGLSGPAFAGIRRSE